ncbi:MAG: RNA polymerase sigma factor [Chitinophagales bacterium]
MTEYSEDILIKGCINRDRQSQNSLYKKYQSRMFAVCYQYSKSREEAEDTFHEGFMKVFDNIASFAKKGTLEGWIRKIMVNTAIEKYRKGKHLSFIINMEDTTEVADHYFTDDILDRIEAAEFIQLIQKLPPSYQMVFNLYVMEGMKHKEISADLGISEGTSKSNLYEAKSILRNLVNKNNGSPQAVGSEYGRKQRY